MRLEILWQRVTVGAETCARCGETGESVRRATEALRAELGPRGVTVELTEKALPPFAVQESNRVFFNGVPVEELLGAQVGQSHCQSCCDLLGGHMNGQTDCRTLILDGREHEDLPEGLLVRAGLLAADRLAAE